MDKLRVFETFAGIGAQHKALERLLKKNLVNYEMVATSEWDIDAIICYDAIHHGNIKNLDALYKDMFKEISPYTILEGHTFSSDGKVPISNLARLSEAKLKRLAIAFTRNKNVGSIVEVDPINIPDHDILTYSFPCQDLSIASMGRGKGMSKEANSRSGLLWEIERILKGLKEQNRLPKYLLLENVTAMLNANNIDQYNLWLEELEKMGYKTNTFKFNALDFGVPQVRKRVFAVSVLGETNNITEDTILSYTKDLRITERTEYKKIDKFELSEILKNERNNFEKILDHGSKFIDECNMAQPNNTPSRIKMRMENHKLEDNKYTYVRTITTKQDRHPNAGMINYQSDKKDTTYRFLTPRECYMLMGFDSTDFDKVKVELLNEYTRKEKLYQQAGNSIVVNILESIFRGIWENEHR
jgi:DNA (cytosine-5)-methyltransferase 1